MGFISMIPDNTMEKVDHILQALNEIPDMLHKLVRKRGR
jgi:hypothetical protein